MKTSIRSGLPRCRGLHFAYDARKPSTEILKTFNRQPATCSVALLDAGRCRYDHRGVNDQPSQTRSVCLAA
jgi:hypothetical protein